MSFLKALCHLVHHQSSHIPSDQLAFLSSPEGFAAAAEADCDVAASVATMIDSLQGVALDPLHGTEIGRFVLDWGDEWGFNLHFHHLSHFVNVFSVPKASPLAAELVTAIEANLQSKMFRAAQIQRRLHSRLNKLRSLSSSRGRAVYQAYVREHTLPTLTRSQHEEIATQAAILSEQATAPREASLLKREQFLHLVSSPKLAGLCWSNWVADRLVAVLPRFVPEHA